MSHANKLDGMQNSISRQEQTLELQYVSYVLGRKTAGVFKIDKNVFKLIKKIKENDKKYKIIRIVRTEEKKAIEGANTNCSKN